MAFVIKKDDKETLLKAVLIIIILVIIVIAVYLLWKLVILPISKGNLVPPSKVSCVANPDTPTNFTGFADADRAILQWDGVSNTDNYTVYMAQTPLVSPTNAERTITVYGNSVAVLNLLPVTYYFIVVANNSCGVSSPSAKISVTITTVASSFKICKKDDPLICLLMQSDGAPALMSQDCPSGECNMSYPAYEFIKTVNDNLCLFENPNGILNVEQPVTSKTCTNPTKWSIDLSTGRIISQDNLCLGAHNTVGSPAFNTNCTVISNPEDARYAWVIQPNDN